MTLTAGPRIAFRSLSAFDRTAVFALICTDLLGEQDPNTPSDDIAASDFRALNTELDRSLAGSLTTHFIVALADAAIVGVVAVTESFMARPGVWELGWQVVRADYQQQGIGLALLHHAERYARDHGAEVVTLSSGEPEHHRRAGYRIVVESENETVMARTLG